MSVVLLSILVAAIAPRSPVSQVGTYDSGGPLIPEQAAYDVTFYDLRLRVTPSDSTIAGTLTVVADVIARLDQLVLDLDERLGIGEVVLQAPTASGTSLTFERRRGKTWIELPGTRTIGDRITVQVTYGGKPRIAPNPPWSGGFTWSRTPSGEPWIATTCQQEGPDIWWPSKDHPSDEPDSMALHVTVPDPLVVASNGRLTGVDHHPDHTSTYHWFVSTPINSYNVALNIAPYRAVEDSFTSITGEVFPVVFWALPQSYEKAARLLPEILDHLRFFEDVAGPYPFRADKYGVVETPHLGMEHQTIIAYGGNFMNGAMTDGVDWGSDALHHHELSHEWWGNLVTNSEWSDMWLHEGFGSYMQPLYLEQSQGVDAAREYLANLRHNISNRSALAPRQSRSAKQIYGGDIYFKGAWVLHTLRYLVGDEDFRYILRRMAYPDPAMESVTDGGQTRFATTDDFLAMAEKISGLELDWFFEVYVRQPQLPRLRSSRRGNTLELAWQIPGGLEFPLPVDVLVGRQIHRVPMPGARGTLSVPAHLEPTIDPFDQILMDERRR
jgi:aminopeptidase N